MPRTLITPIIPVDGARAAPLGATALNLTDVAADVVNGNAVLLTGQEIVLLRNTDTVARTVTIDSVPDGLGREADIISYSIPPGVLAAISFFGAIGVSGWKQTDGNLYVNASSALIRIIVLRLGV